ncbi:hypothetical protein GF337_10070 [candidate division KSB1 bacterium]|nr:hypothetical protein [candidate division KSB1 bacterium]
MSIIKKFTVFALLGMFTLLIVTSCEIYEEKDYDISALDKQGCELLQDSITVDISAVDLTSFNEDWNNQAVFQNVPQVMDSLDANGIVLNQESTCYVVSTPGALDTTYIDIDTDLNSIVLFVNEFLRFNFINSDGSILEPADESFDPATVFYSELTAPEEWDVDCSEMKNRVVYNLEQTKKLIQIIKPDQPSTHKYRFVFMANQK